MYTKADQLKSNRIKPKKSQKNKDRVKPKGLSDKPFMTWLHDVKQPVCFSCGRQNGIELHHIKEASTDAKNDREVLPLCGIECHRLGKMLSAHGTPSQFREVYPVKKQRAYALKLYLEYKETL